MYTTPLFNMNQLQKVSKKMLVNQINLKIYNLHIFTFIYILPFSISVIDSFKKWSCVHLLLIDKRKEWDEESHEEEFHLWRGRIFLK